MKTYNIGFCPDGIIESQLRKLEAALGSARCTARNPCGTSAYYDVGESKPWRLADDQNWESFARFEDAMAHASSAELPAPMTWHR
jgi:hypothetical protein